MINNVKNAFKRNFKNLEWMDEDTRKDADIKADAISDMIGRAENVLFYHNFQFISVLVAGYPEFIKDVNQLDERYEGLKIRSDTYFNNNINLNAYNLKKNLEKINEPVNKTTWSEYFCLC